MYKLISKRFHAVMHALTQLDRIQRHFATGILQNEFTSEGAKLLVNEGARII